MGSLVTGALAVPQRVVYDPPLHIDDGHGVPPLYFRDERSDGYHFVLDREAFRSATVAPRRVPIGVAYDRRCGDRTRRAQMEGSLRCSRR